MLYSGATGDDTPTLGPGNNIIGQVRIADGDGTTVADVLDLATANPLTVAIVDATGAQITSFGGTGDVQYTEGDVDTSITGTAAMMEVAGDVLEPIQGTVADGLLVNLGTNNDVTVTGSVTAIAQPGVDIGDVTVNNGAGAAAVNIQDGGNSITVDGTLTTTATDFDIRDLDFATDSVDVSGSTVTANQGTPNSTVNRWPVQITDGVDLALVTAAGEQNVIATAQPGVDIGDVTINNGAGAAAVNIQDGGNSITVDAVDLDIRDLTFATDTVDVSGSAVTAVVTGTVTANQGTPAATANRWPVQITDGTDLVLVTAAGEQNVLATAQPGVDLGDVTINNAAGAGAVNIQDGGNSITIDGTVSVTEPVTVDSHFLSVPFSTTVPTNVGSTDVGAYRWVSVQILTQGTSSIVTFQGSNDNADWDDLWLTRVDGKENNTATANPSVIFNGPLPTRYFRLLVTGISAGTTSGVIIFWGLATQSVSQGAHGDRLHDSTDGGTLTAPVKIGGYASLTAPVAVASADRVSAWFGLNGQFIIKVTPSATATTSQVADSATSVQLLAANSNRLGATIQNDSSAILYVKLGTTASLTDYTVQLAALTGFYTVTDMYVGRIDGIWATDPNTGAARITELT